MEVKKNPKVDVGRNSSIYFAIGLNLMLLTTYLMFEHKFYEKDNYVQKANSELVINYPIQPCG